MTEELRGPAAAWAAGQQAWLERWYQETRDELLDVSEHPRGMASSPLRFVDADGSEYVRIHPDQLGGP